LKKLAKEVEVYANNAVSPLLLRFLQRIKGLGKKSSDVIGAARRFGEVKYAHNSRVREVLSNALEFDVGSLLHPKALLYIPTGALVFLFQVYNTLAINNLSVKNEKLREQIQMTSSVITSQELKMDELHSIRNIAPDAAALGLSLSSMPPVELEP
jgi:hypothetical protein